MTNNTDLVTSSTDGTPVTTSLAIAEGTDVQHKNVMELIRTYLPDLQEFGLVAFETRARLDGQHGGGNTEYAILNEQQSTLILTYMRNSDIVRGFKKRLVKAFYDMRRALNVISDKASDFIPKTKVKPKEIETAFRSMINIAKMAGYEGNHILLAANTATNKLIGVKPLELVDRTYLPAPVQEMSYTPTAIGVKFLGLGNNKGRTVNELLTKKGLQTSTRDHNGDLVHEPTSLGKAYGEYGDTNKQHGDGTPVKQWKWYESVVSLLKDESAEGDNQTNQGEQSNTSGE